MVQKIAKIPGSASEVEEAEWWFNQRDVLTEQAETAMRLGQFHLRQPSTSIRPKTITLELPYQDRNQAPKKGHPLRKLFVPTSLLHDTLANEKTQSATLFKTRIE